MAINAKLGGYPGVRRIAPLSGQSGLDLPRSRRLSFPANDPIFRNTRPASETFLRDRTVRTFGKKIVTDAELKVMRHVLARGLLKAVPYVGLAVTAYEIVELLKPGTPGSTGVRDPMNASDMAITFPSPLSVTELGEVPPTFAEQYVVPGTTVYPNGMAEHIHPNVPVTHFDEYPGYYEPRTPQDVVANGLPAGSGLMEENYVDSSADWAGTNTGYWARRAINNPTGLPHPAEWTNPASASAGSPSQIILLYPPWRSTMIKRRPNVDDRPLNTTPWPVKRLDPGDNREPWYDQSPWPKYASPQPGASPFPSVGWVPGPVVIGQPYQPIAETPVARGPPKSTVKEKKVKIRRGGVIQFIRAAAGFTTELLDAVNAFYYALDPQYRPGYYPLHKKDGSIFYKKRWNASQAQRMGAVYEHFDKIELLPVLRNVIKNEIEDALIGRVSKWHQGTPGVQEYGHGRSFQFGPWDTGFGT